MRKLSITTKITIWYTIFLLIIVGCFFIVLVHMGNLQASGIAQTRLMDSVADASEEIERVGEDFIIDDDLVFYEDGVYLSVYDGEEDLIEGRRPIELEHLPQLQDKNMETLKDSEGQTWYIYDSRFDLQGKPIWVRGIVKDFAEQSTYSYMVRISVFAFPALLILATLGGYLITRRAFGPVRSMIRTVEEISRDGDLSRRVHLDSGRGGRSSDREAKDEIHHLALTFNGMFDKLEKAFEKEKRFTSDVSHELRTPLAVIISQSDYAKTDEEYRERALEVINRESKRMAQLVNRLLTLVRSDEGRLRLEKEQIDFSDMCEMVAEQQIPIAAQKGITISTDIQQDIQICGDDAMLIRVVLNLTDNAVKYGRQKGHIRLSLTEENGFARCSVEDDGIGISEENLEKIWERFYRVDAARGEEGSGLGLSMVEALVKAHGGHVEVQSRLGEGSRFDVFLPICKDEEN